MLNVAKYNPLNIALFFMLESLNIFLENRVIINLFKIKIEKKEKLKLFIFQLLFELISFLIFPIQIYYSLNIVVKFILFKKLLNLKKEELYLSTIVSIIIKTMSTTVLFLNNKYIANINLESILSIIINFSLILLIKHKNIVLTVKDCYKEKEKNRIKFISIFSIVSLILIKIIIISDIEKIPTYVYILLNLMQASYLIILIKAILSALNESNANIKIENLEGSNKRLQENYDNVRAFKHDFNNIMQGIGGFIASNDISGLNEMYKSIIKECQEINDKQSINEDIITNPAILNLINNKIKLAEKNDIKIKVKVYIDLNTLKVSTYDLCRVLGILIDNAIEACTGCEDKTITIKFLRDKFNNRNLIIIENPYKNYLIDIKKIYEKGFSSKKDKISHGLGLWKVKQILKKNKNIQIYTSRDKLFKQQLEIY